jgi:hypothetical protein
METGGEGSGSGIWVYSYSECILMETLETGLYLVQEGPGLPTIVKRVTRRTECLWVEHYIWTGPSGSDWRDFPLPGDPSPDPSTPPDSQLVSLSILPDHAQAEVDEVKTFSVTATYSNGATHPITGPLWSSSDTDVATKDDPGTFQAQHVGTTTVTFRVGSIQATATLDVMDNRMAEYMGVLIDPWCHKLARLMCPGTPIRADSMAKLKTRIANNLKTTGECGVIRAGLLALPDDQFYSTEVLPLQSATGVTLAGISHLMPETAADTAALTSTAVIFISKAGLHHKKYPPEVVLAHEFIHALFFGQYGAVYHAAFEAEISARAMACRN